MEEIHLNPIHLFWIGQKLSPIEILCCKSCLQNGMTPILWCYEDIEDVPNGVIIKDANALMTKETVDYYVHNLKLPIPNISDLFRYQLLHQIGGIYSDTDIIFTENIYKIDKDEFFCSTFEYNKGIEANGCLMKLNQASQVSSYLVNEARLRLDKFITNGGEIDYCEFGPFIVQKCAEILNVEILDYDVVNPISWRWVNKIIAYKKFDKVFHFKLIVRKLMPFLYESRGYFITKNTKAIHLCHEMWNTYRINKFERMNSLCLYEKLKKKFDHQ